MPTYQKIRRLDFNYIIVNSLTDEIFALKTKKSAEKLCSAIKRKGNNKVTTSICTRIKYLEFYIQRCTPVILLELFLFNDPKAYIDDTSILH
jgi:hypothetical protein